MKSQHSFDTKGFYFAIGLMALFVFVGIGGKYGFAYAGEKFRSAPRIASDTARIVVDSVTDAARAMYSSTTPQRVINSLTIADVVPAEGKFVAADLVNMKMILYEDGQVKAEYPIISKGRPRTPYETPGGFYSVLSKNINHFNRSAQVYLPYSMQFYGNYFVHGWPVYVDGRPVDPTYSGGCIRLSTSDASRLFAFADKGMKLFVYDPGQSSTVSSLALAPVRVPNISAESYLIADIDTGDVLLERNALIPRPIASVTKLMTALVANETIMFDKDITVKRAHMSRSASTTSGVAQFTVGELLYPLLMESNNAIADDLAAYYGSVGFIQWMNTAAQALSMTETHFEDASGMSKNNVSTADDLFRLAVYLTTKKAFIWDVTSAPTKTITSDGGPSYSINNYNKFSNLDTFVGGKVGYTESAKETMVSVFTTNVGGVERRAAIVVLRSDNIGTDTKSLSDWYTRSSMPSAATVGTACATCATPDEYRKIEL